MTSHVQFDILKVFNDATSHESEGKNFWYLELNELGIKGITRCLLKSFQDPTQPTPKMPSGISVNYIILMLLPRQSETPLYVQLCALYADLPEGLSWVPKTQSQNLLVTPKPFS